MTEFRTLDALSEQSIIHTFLDAFADYATSFSAQQVSSILKFRGFDPRLSFGAFDGEHLVSFVLNGIGAYLGVPSAYDSGTGTLPEYRGLGLVRDLLDFGEKSLREHGIRQYVLEVLCDNTPAIHIYEKGGFAVERELICFSQKKSMITARNKSTDDVEITIAGSEILPHIAQWVDFQPSWQNSVQSLARGGGDVTYVAALSGGKPIGVAAINAPQGDLMMLAVEAQWRGRGVGSRLLGKAVSRAAADSVKMLNVDARCESMLGFLKSRNMAETARQYEMIKSLD